MWDFLKRPIFKVDGFTLTIGIAALIILLAFVAIRMKKK